MDPAIGMVALGVDIEPIQGIADTGRFADDLAALFEVLGGTSRDLGLGTLVLVDELQEASAADLTAINTAVHGVGQADSPLPVALVGAGLPSLPAQLAEATSYAERLYAYRPIGLSLPDSARDALIQPSLDHGAAWQEDAISRAIDVAAGYPYFLQAVGKHVWDAARSSPITLDDVEVGTTFARREVDEGLYRSRWERATPAQRDLLRAIATQSGEQPAAVSDLCLGHGQEARVRPLCGSQRAHQEGARLRSRAGTARVHRSRDE